MKVSGKIALVTGAAQGLGKSFAAALLKNGAKVLISDVNSEAGKATLKAFQDKYGENNVMFVRADVTSQAQMEAVFQQVRERFGGLDIMSNNAGIIGETREVWEKTVDVNLKGVIRGTNLALDLMRRDKGGRGGVIVNTASIAGLMAVPGAEVYTATKHGVIGFSRSWARSPLCADNGVRVNVLCPSFADTALLPRGGSADGDVGKYMDEHGVMSPEYVAEGFLDLVQDDSKNGAVLKMGEKLGKVYVEY
ncbi:15-hydroxyprostaglandin dehydrogenase [NAD(+)]-like [Haliotis rubra]|uniref:15-hydroxyprostaglandin dehydrogenase [NAD(+)]-like n=1 Tax=Haliotis rubra TaxID=36100 RepID=UPI001EE51602|nr:15-hydroxyprostaglandin dehydrogenase [NAD(+)]-like [Haliotis rubra]